MFQIGQMVRYRGSTTVGRVSGLSFAVSIKGVEMVRKPMVTVNWGSWMGTHDEDALIPTNQVRVLTRRVRS